MFLLLYIEPRCSKTCLLNLNWFMIINICLGHEPPLLIAFVWSWMDVLVWCLGVHIGRSLVHVMVAWIICDLIWYGWSSLIPQQFYGWLKANPGMLSCLILIHESKWFLGTFLVVVGGFMWVQDKYWFHVGYDLGHI